MKTTTMLSSSSFQHVLDRAFGLATCGLYAVAAVLPNGVEFRRVTDGASFFVFSGGAS